MVYGSGGAFSSAMSGPFLIYCTEQGHIIMAKKKLIINFVSR